MLTIGKQKLRIALITFIIILCSCSQFESKKFEIAVDNLRSYQFGDSRAALSEIESLVSQTTEEADKKIIASHLAEILDTDISFAAKQFICQQLRVIGNEEQLPVLTKLLQDEEFTNIAIFALETMPSPKVDEILRNSLNNLTNEAKIAVINALAERRDKYAVKDLAQLLSDSDHQIAEAAALALGKIGTSEAGAEIKKSMDKANGKWRSDLANHYMMCAHNLVASGEMEPALNIYREMSEQYVDKHIQMQASYGLVTTGQRDATDFVSKAINDDDTIVRRLAMLAVVQSKEDDATLKFCKLLDDLPPGSQALLLNALSDRGDPEALSTVVNLLDHNEKGVRIVALGAMAKLGDETVVPLLLQKTIVTEVDESETARISLYRLKGATVDSKVLEMTNDKNVELRLEAIKALSARNVVMSTPTLLKMLNDPNESIRLESWYSLAELGSDKDLALMISSWVQSQNDDEIQVAEEAVVKVFRKETIQKSPTSDIVAAVNTVERKEIKISLINALGKIGDKESLPQLRGLLKSEDPEIKKATIRAFSSWPTDEPLKDLHNIITTTTDETEKIIALRGYIQLIGVEKNRESAETIVLYNNAMKLAWRTEEKNLVLAGYSQITDIAALKAVEPYLLSNEVKNEAAAAAIRISEELIEETSDENDRKLIVAIMDIIIKKGETATIREEASEILTRMEE